MSFNAGDVVGDYQVIGTLGAGGMGEVYKVRHVISQREEAMKVLLRDLGEDPARAERFSREIQLHARLNHPNIAGMHTAFHVGNQLLMVMELVEGDSLRSLMRGEGVGLWQGVDIIRQVLEALAYSHEMGITHRDIKPSNIMLTTQGQVKLLDFGLATASGDQRLTRTGAIVGSLHYMPPEQIRSETVDARSDIYSVGATLWEIAAGKVPFDGGSDYAIIMGHLEDAPAPPRDSRPAVPDTLWSALLKALAKKPADRFQTANEFHEALSGLREGSSTIAARAMGAFAETRTIHSPAVVGAAPADPALLDEISKHLAVYVGPIARVLVKRAAPKASSLEELYKSLAAEIDSPQDRGKFLATPKRRL